MAIRNESQFQSGDGDGCRQHAIFFEDFDEESCYEGDDLGVTYGKQESIFRLWAPTAEEAHVALYSSWEGEPDRVIPMAKKSHGLWRLSVEGDLDGRFYTYRVRLGSVWNEAVDPYAKAVGVNGDKGAVIDLRRTDPEGWNDAKPPLASPTDAVIYELHIRDLSMHPKSGITHKGKFLGLTEKGTRGPEGLPSGLDHIVDLGVTHVQLLPIFDFCRDSVDETNPNKRYNWGYDPKNFNVPEGAYATDPYDPAVRIRELKRLVQTLHDSGLRVIMDVVYNHVYDGYLTSFTQLVPGYYLRYKKDGSLSNGSFCGNDTATERRMVSKFIVESVLHWAKEYHMDGFRFDLMGLIDVKTMQEIRRRLDEIDPSILTYGEGWELDTEISPDECANVKQAHRMPGVGHFNGVLRDALKGDIFHAADGGFIQGAQGRETAVKSGIAGSIDYSGDVHSFAADPNQAVNFAECHDNHTLWDRLALSASAEPEEVRRAMHRLASAVVLTSQGIPFLHAGQEFMRTKKGIENSYNAPDEINRLDWERRAALDEDVQYMKRLIALRKTHPAFRLNRAEAVRKHLHFEAAPAGVVAFTLRDHAGGDPDKHLYVLYNTQKNGAAAVLPDLGEWEVEFGAELAALADKNRLAVHGIGMVVLAVRP